MTDPTPPPSEEPTEEVPVTPPAPPAAPLGGPAARRRGPNAGHVVLGLILVLIGLGWLMEALGVADVPWRFLLPSALILVGLALTLGARTGRHGGLLAVGVVLTVLVLLAGAVEVLVDVPLAGGMGDETYRPTGVVEKEYRWGIGQMTLDLGEAEGLQGRSIAASVVLGELVVIVPEGLSLEVTARAGIGDVNVLGTTRSGVDAGLECAGAGREVRCGSDLTAGERPLRLDLRVAVGKVEVRR
jgi:hypothetical protein